MKFERMIKSGKQIVFQTWFCGFAHKPHRNRPPCGHTRFAGYEGMVITMKFIQQKEIAAMENIINWLLEEKEPSIRYRTMAELLDKPEPIPK